MHGAHEGLTPARPPQWRARLALAAILATGFAIRLAYLRLALRMPGFRWDDPDGYLDHARMLARPEGWHWTFDVAKYVINGQVHALPPLYSIFLSLLALFPGMPLSALIAQIVLSTLAIAFVFMAGRLLHSSATGLWASAGYALSAPTILNVWSTSQETLYIPLLLLAFVLYGRALAKESADPELTARDARPYVVAGAVLGLAALTRSMPLFFVLPLAALHIATAANRRAAVRESAAYLAGFAVVVVPYCAGLSRALGQLTLIDSHGSIHVDAASSVERAPGVAATVEALWRLLAADPVRFVQECAGRARSLLYVNGGRQLQIYIVGATRGSAMVWKIVVHLGTDALLIAAAVLAWPGATLARNTRLALVFLAWAALNIAVASVGGFGGARLRAPFEPLLMILGAVVLAGDWRSRPRPVVAVGVALGVMMALVVVPQLPRSFRSWPDYGVRWPSVLNREVGTIHGDAAFNVPAYAGVAGFRVQSLAGAEAVQVDVRAGGVTVRSVRLNREGTSITWPWPERGLAFAEVRAVDAGTTTPADVRVEVGPR
jgi:4-amino-4-deoxy-L-arabinose transferase-like glycosyltransferase